MDNEQTTVPREPVRQPVVLSALAFLAEENSIRMTVERDLSVPLKSFTVSYRFAAKSKSGGVTESRFFTLTYDRSGLNEKDAIAIRLRVPAGYDAVGCTAFVSRIVTDEGENEIAFDSPDATVLTTSPDGVNLEKLKKGRKKLSKKQKIGVIAVSSVVATAALVLGIIGFTKFLGIRKIVNGLVEEGRYGEAYRIAETCSTPAMERIACGNIVSKALNERDYKTAYAYAAEIGRENTVFKRVSYEILNSGVDALQSDALAVLRKTENDEFFDETLAEVIDSLCQSGDYPAALAAVGELRTESERNLKRRNVLVGGVCYYAATGEVDGIGKYDRALEFFHSTTSGDDVVDASIAEEIVNTMLADGDTAGAIALSVYFADLYETFAFERSAVEIKPNDPSISHSLDYSYPLLTDDQKRAYHASTLAVSEEMFVIRDGVIAGTGIRDAVSVATYENRTAVLRRDGSVTHLENNGHNTTSTVPSGVNGVQIAVGLSHTVVLEADGTVKAFGSNARGQCNTAEWTDIVSIAAGRYFTVGLKSNGTLVACGSDKSGECFIKSYRHVIAIAACDQTTVLLFRDGTVHLQGECSFGLNEANNFTDVEEIAAGGSIVIAKHTDGTFSLASGTVTGNAPDVSEWRADETEAYAAGSQCIAYLSTNGKVTITGDGAPN